jgi:hypothetical protein
VEPAFFPFVSAASRGSAAPVNSIHQIRLRAMNSLIAFAFVVAFAAVMANAAMAFGLHV